jgi:hypothetical protein
VYRFFLTKLKKCDILFCGCHGQPPEEKLLTKETIQKVLHLLEKGCSRRKVAELSDVSVWSVQKIANSKRPYSRRSMLVSKCFTNPVNSIWLAPLELHGDALRRYNEVHKRKTGITRA